MSWIQVGSFLALLDLFRGGSEPSISCMPCISLSSLLSVGKRTFPRALETSITILLLFSPWIETLFVQCNWCYSIYFVVIAASSYPSSTDSSSSFPLTRAIPSHFLMEISSSLSGHWWVVSTHWSSSSITLYFSSGNSKLNAWYGFGFQSPSFLLENLEPHFATKSSEMGYRATDGVIPDNNSSGFFSHYARTTQLHVSHRVYRHSAQKLTGAPQCVSEVSIAFIIMRFM